MTEILIKSDNDVAVKAISKYAKSFQALVEIKKKKKKKMPLIPRDKSISAESLAGMFKTKNPPSVEEIREKMWKKR